MAPDLTDPSVGFQVPLAANAESIAFFSTSRPTPLPALADEVKKVGERLAALRCVV